MPMITHWLRRFFGREKPVIPDTLWRSAVSDLPFLERLSDEDLARLKEACETFLHRKSVSGAAGLDISDEIAVAIAIQACLLVLNLTLDLYDDMPGVIVYPSEFIVPRSEVDEAGVVHEWEEPLAGEALDAGGAVVLSWEDVEQGDALGEGYNVVIHEFAHKIDMGRGAANGCPPFLPAFHRDISPREWQHVFSEAYADFSRRVDHLERQAARAVRASRSESWANELPLDPYAASNPAEFFAVASEAFFLTPEYLAEDYPDVYRLLACYYRQETLSLDGA
ncbi:MAG TPA: M90 family metallopeptidase [Paucimonas sp.]|nr:M90 family metallopeptidase [Paucimonas sp.]